MESVKQGNLVKEENLLYLLGDEGLNGELVIIEACSRQESVKLANRHMGYDDEHYWEIIETSKARRDIINKKYFEGLS